MATKLKLVPFNVANGKIAISGKTTHHLGVEVPANATEASTTANANGNTSNYYQFVPGSSTTTSRGTTVPTTPDGSGWVLPYVYDAPGGTGIQNVTCDYQFKFVVGSGSAFTVEIRFYRITSTGASISASATLGSLTLTNVSGTDTRTGTVTWTARSLGANEWIYVEMFARMTTNGTTDTIALQTNNGVNASFFEMAFDDAGVLTIDDGNSDFVMWNDQVAAGFNRWGENTFHKNVAENLVAAARNYIPTTAQANTQPLQFQPQINSSVQNIEFQTALDGRSVEVNNPIFSRVAATDAAHLQSATFNAVCAMWYGKPFFTFAQAWWGASSSTVNRINARYASTNSGTANQRQYTNLGTSHTQSTAGAGVNGWAHTEGSTIGIVVIPDRHRSGNYNFSFVNDGSNINNSTTCDLGDGTNSTQTYWMARMLVAHDTAANVATALKDKYLENYNTDADGPPDTTNGRFAVYTGTVKADADTDGTRTSILDGFDYENLAFRVTAASNEIKVKVQSPASYAFPFRCFIIENYTAATAPVVAESTSQGGTYTEMDTGVTSNAGTTYKGTNYASHVDTTNDVAYVVIYGDLAANTTRYYQIIDSLATAWDTQLSDSISSSDAIKNKAQPKFSESQATADAISLKPSIKLSDSQTLAEALAFLVKPKFSETISTADTVSFSVFAAMAESLSLVENLAMKWAGTLSETQTMDDSTSKAGAKFVQVLTEILDMSTEALRLKTLKKIDDQLIGSSDTLASLLTLRQLIEEGITIAENLAMGVKVKYAETISIAEEQFNKTTKYLTDVPTISETVATIATYHRSISETVSLLEAMQSAVKAVLAESVTSADATDHVHWAYRTLSEVATLSDEIFNKAIFTLSDTQSLADAFFPKVLLSLADTQAMADAIVKFPKSVITQTISMIELMRLKPKVPLTGDGVSLDDGTSTRTPKPKFSETITLVEGAVSFFIQSVLNEIITITDSVQTGNALNVSETIAMVDDLSFNIKALIADTASVVDEIFNKVVLDKFTETISMVDSITTKFLTLLQDSQAMTDAAEVLRTLGAIVQETISLADDMRTRVMAYLAEEMSLGDTFEFLTFFSYTFTDAIGVADEIYNAAKTYFSEAVGVADTLTSIATYKRTLTEGITLVETFARNLYVLLEETYDGMVDAFIYTYAITVDFIVKANIRQAIQQNITHRAQILDLIRRDLVARMQTLKLASQDLRARMTARENVGDNTVVLNNVNATVGISLTAQMNVHNRVQRVFRSLASIWNKVGRDFGIGGATIVNFVGLEITTLMNSRENTTQTLTFLSNTEQHIGSALTQRAGVLENVGDELATRMGILLNAGRTLDFSTNFLLTVGQSLIVDTGFVYGLVGASITSLANQDANVGVDVVSSAKVQEAIAKSLVVKSNVSEIVTQFLTHEANVFNRVGNQLVSVADMYHIAGKSLTTIAHTNEIVNLDFDVPSNVLNVVGEERTSVANVFELVGADLANLANLMTLVGTDLATVMTGRQLATKDVVSLSNVYEILTRDFEAINQILTNVNLELTALADVHQLAGNEVTERARIRAVLGKNLEVLSQILTKVHDTLTISGNVTRHVGTELTTVMAGEGKVVRNLPSFAAVAGLVTKSLTTSANVADPIIRTFRLDPILESYTVEALGDYVATPYYLDDVVVSSTLGVSYKIKR